MTEKPERLADYRRDPHYERRVVVFYDVLGWRNHIAATGDNPKRIGDLRRLILQHVRTLGLRTHMNIRVSTFSDNVVITQSLGPDTPWLIAHRGINRVASTIKGFLLRGVLAKRFGHARPYFVSLCTGWWHQHGVTMEASEIPPVREHVF